MSRKITNVFKRWNGRKLISSTDVASHTDSLRRYYQPRMNTEPQPRNDFIDFLKGGLIFLVVYGHMIQGLGYARTEPWEESGFWSDPVFKLIYMFHMPLFMALSGYVSYEAIQNKRLGEVVWRRFQQLIIPAICWITLYCGLQFLIEITSGGGHAFSLYAVPKNLVDRICSDLWFLWVLFGSIVVVTCLRSMRLDRIEVLTLIAILALLLPNFSHITMFKYTFPYYCAGYVVAAKNRIRITPPSPTLVMALFGLSVACYLFWDNTTYVYISSMGRHPGHIPLMAFRYVAGGVLSVAFVVAMHYFYRLWQSATISTFGRLSLEIYIIQSVIQWYFFRLADGANHVRIFHDLSYFTYTLAPAISLCICFFSVGIGGWLGRIPHVGALLMGRVKRYQSAPLSLPIAQSQPSP